MRLLFVFILALLALLVPVAAVATADASDQIDAPVMVASVLAAPAVDAVHVAAITAPLAAATMLRGDDCYRCRAVIVDHQLVYSCPGGNPSGGTACVIGGSPQTCYTTGSCPLPPTGG